MLALLVPGVGMGAGNAAPPTPFRVVTLTGTFVPNRTLAGTSGQARLTGTFVPTRTLTGG